MARVVVAGPGALASAAVKFAGAFVKHDPRRVRGSDRVRERDGRRRRGSQGWGSRLRTAASADHRPEEKPPRPRLPTTRSVVVRERV